jgi:hypothetical protein
MKPEKVRQICLNYRFSHVGGSAPLIPWYGRGERISGDGGAWFGGK